MRLDDEKSHMVGQSLDGKRLGRGDTPMGSKELFKPWYVPEWQTFQFKSFLPPCDMLSYHSKRYQMGY